MGTRHNYMTKLVDDAQGRAKDFHLKFQEYDNLANKAEAFQDCALEKFFRGKANALLNDFFYWIGHSNAYRGIRMQVEMWEEIDAELDAEASCP